MTSTSHDGRLLIGGAWQTTPEGTEDVDPGSGEVIGHLARATTGDVANAVDAACEAGPAWARAPASERRAILLRAADTLESQVASWAVLMAREMGKALAEARLECARAVSILRFFASDTWRPIGEHYESDNRPTWLFTRRRPVGTVGIITPWNFPAAIPTWKLAPALAYGNTVVFKPADDAALTGLVLVQALHQAGLPAGVLNAIVGEGSKVGPTLCEHEGIQAISFTGSTEVGDSILASAAPTGKRVQLEMGGHNPVIVRADANVASAVSAVALGAFASAGQKCTATRRVYVAEAVYEPFIAQLVERAANLKVSRGLDPDCEMGSLVNEAALTEVLAAVERATTEGRLEFGGQRLRHDDLDRGAFMSPTVVSGLPTTAELACREVFGPVVAVWPVADDNEALERANDTAYGLSAAIFTRDLDMAKAFVEQIEVGLVHVNSQTAGAEVHVPFGGLGKSGYGPHEQGRAAIEFFTEQQTVYLDPAG